MPLFTYLIFFFNQESPIFLLYMFLVVWKTIAPGGNSHRQHPNSKQKGLLWHRNQTLDPLGVKQER